MDYSEFDIPYRFQRPFFVLGGINHGASVWISYGFIHFAYFMLLITPLLIHAGRSAAVFGFSLYYISAIYFLVEIFAGTVFILVSPEGYTAAFSIQIIIAGLYGITLIANVIANERTAGAEAKRQVAISFIKDASAKLKGLLESIDDKEVKKKVEQVYDALYSSPVKSHPDLEQIETRILQSIYTLEEAIVAGNKDGIIFLAGSLETMIDERNRQLKMYN